RPLSTLFPYTTLFRSLTDLLRYLPRAAVVGFFAPFPSMWFASGRQVGSAGRLLGGLESLAMYVVEGLALLGLWRGRRQLSVWFLDRKSTRLNSSHSQI